MTAEVVIGSISKAWAIGFTLDDVDLPIEGFECRMIVVKPCRTVVVPARAVTTIIDDKFLTYLTVEDTNLLTAGQIYQLAVEVKNTALEKPLCKTDVVEIQAVAGYFS